MWYRTGHGRGAENWQNSTVICHAVSTDGIHWEKPDVTVYNYWGSHANNICCRPHYRSDEECGRFDSMNVLRDQGDPDPLRRYKMMSFQYAVPRKYVADQRWPSGYYASFSSDGLRWREEAAPCLSFVDGGYGDTLTLMHDTKRNRYVCFCKILSPEYGKRMCYRGSSDSPQVWNGEKWITLDSENPAKRMRGMMESEDFVHWEKPRFILPVDDNDPPDIQLYNNSGFIYESLYLGFVDVYHVDSTGTIDVQLAYSRNGINWQRTFDRTPVLPTGRENSDWDYGCHAMAGSPPIRMGDRLYFYYSSSSCRHGGGNLTLPRAPGNRRRIGLCFLRLDGFISLDAGKNGGSAKTKDLVLSHDVLAVNVDSSGGELRAKILSKGKVLPGFDFQSCTPISRDTTRGILDWKGKRLPNEVVTKKIPLQIEFFLRDASLYSFWSEPLTERNV
jgi:hypothetical protein